MNKSYGEVYAPIYDDLFQERDDLSVVATALARFATNGSALEFGIGTGRIAIPLSQCGVQVVGIDVSQAMLDKLSVKPESKNIRFWIGDCTQDWVEGDFSLVYIAFSTLFLVGDQDKQVMCFQNAARHLPMGGTFVVEGFVHDRTRFTHNQEVTTTRIGDEGATMRFASLNPFMQEIKMQTIELSANGITMRPNTLHFIYPLQMDLMGRLAGFQLRERWSDWNASPFTSGSTNQIAIYEKVSEAAI